MRTSLVPPAWLTHNPVLISLGLAGPVGLLMDSVKKS